MVGAASPSGFNSIKVRLKHLWFIYILRVTEFQFHKGTIKTFLPFVRSPVLRSFNSIKVRLKLTFSPLRASQGHLFQFHKGTIKTGPAAEPAAAPACFNSIKVRLKPNENKNIFGLPLFQFHKGTIKTSEVEGGIWYQPCFNSIKVRLKLTVCEDNVLQCRVSIP